MTSPSSLTQREKQNPYGSDWSSIRKAGGRREELTNLLNKSGRTRRKKRERTDQLVGMGE